MANGALVRVLIHTDVTKYLNFKAVDGSFVYNKGKVVNILFSFSVLHKFYVCYYIASFTFHQTFWQKSYDWIFEFVYSRYTKSPQQMLKHWNHL